MHTTRERYRFSVDDYEQMIDSGILTENDRVELIRGEILEKMSIGDRHAGCVNRQTRYWNRILGEEAIVTIQNPIRLPDSEPEPDIALLQPRDDFYASGKPRPNDILLVIEVADTTLDYDRQVKLPMYAEAGIREYWIVNLNDGCLEVHRHPSPNGLYAETLSLSREENVEIASLPGVTIDLHEIL